MAAAGPWPSRGASREALAALMSEVRPGARVVAASGGEGHASSRRGPRVIEALVALLICAARWGRSSGGAGHAASAVPLPFFVSVSIRSGISRGREARATTGTTSWLRAAVASLNGKWRRRLDLAFMVHASAPSVGSGVVFPRSGAVLWSGSDPWRAREQACRWRQFSAEVAGGHTQRG